MKNKTVTIVCIILIILAIISFGYIFINSNSKKENKEEENKQEEIANNDVVQREERTQNIVLTSRIGVQLKEIIKLSDMYSNVVIDELDENGLSDKAKLLFALDKIFRKQEYVEYVEYSDTYLSTAIAAINISKVISDTFFDSQVSSVNVEGVIEYDEASQYYIIPPMGLEGGTINYTIEVPYKITEYSDRIELLAYRVYLTKTVEMEEVTANIRNDIFYDKNKSILALSITDGSLESSADQADYLKNKIDDKTIDSNNLETVQYTFKEENSVYKLIDFKKI